MSQTIRESELIFEISKIFGIFYKEMKVYLAQVGSKSKEVKEFEVNDDSTVADVRILLSAETDCFPEHIKLIFDSKIRSDDEPISLIQTSRDNTMKYYIPREKATEQAAKSKDPEPVTPPPPSQPIPPTPQAPTPTPINQFSPIQQNSFMPFNSPFAPSIPGQQVPLAAFSMAELEAYYNEMENYPITQQTIDFLTEMGFSEDSAREALNIAKGNVELAIDMLTSNQVNKNYVIMMIAQQVYRESQMQGNSVINKAQEQVIYEIVFQNPKLISMVRAGQLININVNGVPKYIRIPRAIFEQKYQQYRMENNLPPEYPPYYQLNPGYQPQIPQYYQPNPQQYSPGFPQYPQYTQQITQMIPSNARFIGGNCMPEDLNIISRISSEMNAPLDFVAQVYLNLCGKDEKATREHIILSMQ